MAAPPLGLRAMAEVRPLHALHYNLGAVGSLEDVIAPPYDVIDAEQRRELVARSPFNVVEIDLPGGAGGRRSLRARGRDARGRGRCEGILTADREPAIWALTQDYTAPDGSRRTAARVPRPSPGRRLRARPDPPPRAHPAGAEGGSAAAHPGDAAQPLPDLLPPPPATPGGTSSPRSRRAVGRGRPTATAPSHRVWRIADARGPRRRSPPSSPTPSC